MGDRRLGQDAVAEVEDKRSSRQHSHDLIDLAVERRAAGQQRQRIDIALHRQLRLKILRHRLPIVSPIKSDGANSGHFCIRPSHDPGTARKSDDLRTRKLFSHAFDDFSRRLDAPALELIRPQHAGPGVEDLQTFGACFELPDQIIDRPLHQSVDQPREIFRIAIGEQPRRCLVGRCLARHHVGRDRPGCAAKSDQRRLAVQSRFDLSHRFIDRRQDLLIDAFSQTAKRLAVRQRLELRSFAHLEFDFAPKRQRYHQNIGKQDCGIEPEAPHRLQRDFGCQFRIETEIEKAARFLPHCTIFRQIPPRLPHHPDRRHGLPLSAEHPQQRLCPQIINFAGFFHKDSYKFLCSGY